LAVCESKYRARCRQGPSTTRNGGPPDQQDWPCISKPRLRARGTEEGPREPCACRPARREQHFTIATRFGFLVNARRVDEREGAREYPLDQSASRSRVAVSLPRSSAVHFLQQHEPYEAHHFGLRLVTPNEPTQELSIDEQRCSTHAVTDAGCNVGNARGLSRAGKVEVFPSADEYKCINKEHYSVDFPFFPFQQGQCLL
jgi:hypothetical protein